jgi:Uma2 family endonuclease
MSTYGCISLGEYLATDYTPEREYIGGRAVARHVGASIHSRMQALLSGWFVRNEDEWNVATFLAQRVQINSATVLVPDLLLTALEPQSDAITHPPVLVVEILAREDSEWAMREKAVTYLGIGIPAVWLIDPVRRRCSWTGGDLSWRASDRPFVPGTPIYADIKLLFARLDDALL